MKIKCCYKCKDRHLGCHSDCEKYIGEKAELERIKERRMKQRESDLVVIAGSLKTKNKQALRKKNNF